MSQKDRENSRSFYSPPVVGHVIVLKEYPLPAPCLCTGLNLTSQTMLVVGQVPLPAPCPCAGLNLTSQTMLVVGQVPLLNLTSQTVLVVGQVIVLAEYPHPAPRFCGVYPDKTNCVNSSGEYFACLSDVLACFQVKIRNWNRVSIFGCFFGVNGLYS